MGGVKSKDKYKPSKSIEKERSKLLEYIQAVEQEKKDHSLKSKESIDKGSQQELPKQTKKDVTDVKCDRIQSVSWPDPDPTLSDMGDIRVDDVTRLNEDTIQRIFFVRCNDDIKYALALARKRGVKVSMRGAKHSMGGHTIARNGFLLDMERMNKMEYHKESDSVTVGAGTLWSDLVYYLNMFSKSPKTLQSYSTFSVGGSVSVNAHGITSDVCLHESIISFDLIKWDGNLITCKKEEDGESGELFGLAIGGYGMFGVITEVTMSVQQNTKLRMDMIQCLSLIHI